MIAPRRLFGVAALRCGAGVWLSDEVLPSCCPTTGAVLLSCERTVRPPRAFGGSDISWNESLRAERVGAMDLGTSNTVLLTARRGFPN